MNSQAGLEPNEVLFQNGMQILKLDCIVGFGDVQNQVFIYILEVVVNESSTVRCN